MMKKKKIFVVTGLLYLVVQVIMGLIFHLIFQWTLLDSFISSISNGAIFFIIWMATAKLIIKEKKKEKE